jgi:hypothetical protein
VLNNEFQRQWIANKRERDAAELRASQARQQKHVAPPSTRASRGHSKASRPQMRAAPRSPLQKRFAAVPSRVAAFMGPAAGGGGGGGADAEGKQQEAKSK